MEAFFFIPFFVVMIAIAIFSTKWHFEKSRSLLEQWADANELTILNRERRYFFRGPYFWTSGKGQDVYYVSVRDRQGNIKSGYVRCGSFWAGMFSDKVTVEWD